MTSDPPIDELNYLAGIKVVDIGDLRVARGKSRRVPTACKHIALVYDSSERRIWCKDCETDVNPFDAFTGLVEQYNGAVQRLTRDREELDNAMKFAAHRRATKVLDEAWRSVKMVPCCPHCRQGLLPEDFADGIGTRVSKEFERARRTRSKK